MSKTIRLEDQVYNDLDEIREKRETFSQSIERLLKVQVKVSELVMVLEGSTKLPEFQQDKLRQLQSGQEEG